LRSPRALRGEFSVAKIGRLREAVADAAALRLFE